MFVKSLSTGIDRARVHVQLRELANYPDGLSTVLGPVRPLDRLRRLAATIVAFLIGYPAGVRDRVPGRAATRTCCCSWSSPRSSRASCCGRCRGRSSSADNGLFLGPLKAIGVAPEDFRLLATPAAVVAGITYNFLPFMTLPLYVALEKIDKRLVEAAEDLYAGPWRPGGTIAGALVGAGLLGLLTAIFEWAVPVGLVAGGVIGAVVGTLFVSAVVPAGRPAAVAAGRVRRLAAHVHPGGRRLRQRRASRDAVGADDRQRHPGPLPQAQRHPDGFGPVVHR